METSSYSDQLAAELRQVPEEYIRDLIRKDEREQSQQAQLATLLREGLDSGISERSVLKILEDAKARLQADGKL